jgi:biotin carboxyl carrier protein
MKRIIRFQMEGQTYQVLVDRSGDELTVEGQGQRYRVSLLREAVGGAAPAGGQAPTPAGAPAATAPPTAIGAASAAGGVAVPAVGAPRAADPGALLAPMTGVVKEIRVSVGHNVHRGQVVLVMEAMKMDIDVPTPTAGVVAEVTVRAGDSVSARQQLLVVH